MGRGGKVEKAYKLLVPIKIKRKKPRSKNERNESIKRKAISGG
jgi:hypothetical protein